MKKDNMNKNKGKKEVNPIFFVIFAVIGGLFLWFLSNHLRLSITPSDGYRIFWIKDECNFDKGDFVMFKISPNDPYVPDPSKFFLIKKITCVPGDKIERKGLNFYCNGFLVAKALTETHDGKPLFPWTPKVTIVPEGQFFVTGSHQRSYDSRYFGLIKREQIKACLYPII